MEGLKKVLDARSIRVLPTLAAVFACSSICFAQGDQTGNAPLIDFQPGQLYRGTHEGGLYPDGSNVIPEAHRLLGEARATEVVPRDAAGNPAEDGSIVMISVGMSNTTHKFAVFERQEDLDANRNARVILVNGGQGGQSAEVIRDPDAPYWRSLENRLTANNLTVDQVQVIWMEEANASRADNFPISAEVLAADLRVIVQNLLLKYPNLKLCYLSSRTYGGYANAEPIAYETGFSVKWLIEDQINGAADLNNDPGQGAVVAPWLAWGPYLWADGVILRSDGLTWEREDYEDDGGHPAPSGEQKVADLLSGFFGGAATATTSWFRVADPSVVLASVDADADAHVSPSTPDTNFGSDPALPLSSSSGTKVYMRFDLGAIPIPITRAKLSMRVPTTLIAPTAQLHIAADSSWSELGITWNNAPPHDSLPFQTTGAITRDGTISADVTGQVNTDTDGVVTFVARAAGGTGGYLSRESDQPPRLILTRAREVPEPVLSIWEWGMIVVMLLILKNPLDLGSAVKAGSRCVRPR